MDAFSKNVTIIPVKSQPMSGPYSSRGVWQVDNINVATDEGGTFSSRILKFGIKLNEFTIPPLQYDILSIMASDLPMGYFADALVPSSNIDFVINDIQPDGQGGATLMLKRKP